MIDKFLEFEKNEDLLNKTINDFHYWAYIRFDIYMHLIMPTDSKAVKEKKTNTRELIIQTINCTIKNPYLWSKKKDILFIPHSRRLPVNGKYECIYTDEIAKVFSENSSSMEFLYTRNQSHFFPVMTKNIFYLD
jgi:hypothetical protein